MEDAATAEIIRCQVWQWVHGGVGLDTGDTVTEEWCATFSSGRWLEDRWPDFAGDARRLFEQVALAEDFPEFLTLPAYELVE